MVVPKPLTMTRFVCDLCNESFVFKYELIVHLKDHQSGKQIRRKKCAVKGKYGQMC